MIGPNVSKLIQFQSLFYATTTFLDANFSMTLSGLKFLMTPTTTTLFASMIKSQFPASTQTLQGLAFDHFFRLISHYLHFSRYDMHFLSLSFSWCCLLHITHKWILNHLQHSAQATLSLAFPLMSTTSQIWMDQFISEVPIIRSSICWNPIQSSNPVFNVTLSINITTIRFFLQTGMALRMEGSLIYS